MGKNMATNLKNLWGWLISLGWKKQAIIVAILAAIIVLLNAFVFSSPAQVQPPGKRAVQLSSVAELSAGQLPLSVVGSVSSKSEATVMAESSGEVTSVVRSLGDTVGAGGVVAEIENASQRAALLQAQGGVDAAQAALDKVQKGTRSEQLAILQSALEGAKSGAVNSLLSAYNAIDSAIPGTTDAFFTNPTSPVPAFKVSTSNSGLKNEVENMRSALGKVLARQQTRSTTLSASDDLFNELSTTEGELRSVRTFLETVIGALNAGIATPDYSQTTINSFITSATAARTAINAALSSIASAKTSVATAQKNLEQGVTGAQQEDVSAAQAALKQAQGTLAAARANLEKTVIRSPITGTINSFSLKRGDFVAMGSPVLTVANNGALEIVAYVTDSDSKEISVGQKASIDSGALGTITRIAPALDPVTKKIEVRIGVNDPDRTLINGQSVLVSIERNARAVRAGDRITIPISAIKVEADKVSVFTIGTSSSLVSNTVTLGALLGDRVEVTAGLTDDMEIVVDARGLRDGQVVEVVE